jgi:hypothetical protein
MTPITSRLESQSAPLASWYIKILTPGLTLSTKKMCASALEHVRRAQNLTAVQLANRKFQKLLVA